MRGTSTGSFLFSHETDELTWTDGSALCGRMVDVTVSSSFDVVGVAGVVVG